LQSPASFFTPAIIIFGVNFGPDANCRCSFWPVARILTCVPPISMTRILWFLPGRRDGPFDWALCIFEFAPRATYPLVLCAQELLRKQSSLFNSLQSATVGRRHSDWQMDGSETKTQLLFTSPSC